MLRTIAAALLATSLIAGPVLAQGAPSAPATTSQPAKVDAKADVKADAKATSKAEATVKTVKTSKKHALKAVKHRKDVKHVAKHKKYGKHTARHNASKYLRVN